MKWFLPTSSNFVLGEFLRGKNENVNLGSSWKESNFTN